MFKVTDALKKKLWTWYQARAAAGEKSLKGWGAEQRPQLTSGQVEAVADALVEDGLLDKEKRASGWVWLKVHDADMPEGEVLEETEPPKKTPLPEPAAEASPEPVPAAKVEKSSPPPAAVPAEASTAPPPPRPIEQLEASRPSSTPEASPVAPGPVPSSTSTSLAAPLAPGDLSEEQLAALLAAKRKVTKAQAAHDATGRELAAALAEWQAALVGKPAGAPPPPHVRRRRRQGRWNRQGACSRRLPGQRIRHDRLRPPGRRGSAPDDVRHQRGPVGPGTRRRDRADGPRGLPPRGEGGLAMAERDTTPSPPPAPALPSPEQLGAELAATVERLLGRSPSSLSSSEAGPLGLAMVHVGLNLFMQGGFERAYVWGLLMRALSTYACPCETCAAGRARVAAEAATKKARQN